MSKEDQRKFDAEAVDQLCNHTRARMLVAKCWCDPRTDATFDPELAEVFAELLDKYIGALQWCSGSDDFQIEGKARVGWDKLCLPLLADANPEPENDREPRP